MHTGPLPGPVCCCSCSADHDLMIKSASHMHCSACPSCQSCSNSNALDLPVPGPTMEIPVVTGWQLLSGRWLRCMELETRTDSNSAELSRARALLGSSPARPSPTESGPGQSTSRSSSPRPSRVRPESGPVSAQSRPGTRPESGPIESGPADGRSDDRVTAIRDRDRARAGVSESESPRRRDRVAAYASPRLSLSQTPSRRVAESESASSWQLAS